MSTEAVATDVEPALFLWVAIGARDEPPVRIEVELCEVCGAIVSAARAERHERWHRSRGGAL